MPESDRIDVVKLAAAQGRLSARPDAAEPYAEAGRADPTATGALQPLALGGDRDGWRYIPVGYRAGQAAPLALMLHGAGGSGRRTIERLIPFADEFGLVLLAPDSRRQTWDILLGGYGPDVLFLNAALGDTFARHAIDPARVAIEGFSDGASYAISLGIGNGDLFRQVIAFSPGFAAPPGQKGQPRFFISHGTRDQVLPIERCSHQLVPALRAAGYAVRYEEFDGPHTVPLAIARQAMLWFLSD